MAEQEYTIDDIIKNAFGDKPVNVQRAFDNIVVQRAADIIAGKREEVARHFGVQPVSDEEVSDEELLADLTDDEVEEILSDDEDEDIEEYDDPSVEDNEDLEEYSDGDEDWPLGDVGMDDDEEDEDTEEK